VGNIAVGTSVHHSHTANSSHYLVSLSTNADKSVGNKHLDVSGDFWLILYNTSPNNARGWNLRYQTTCTNASGRWLRGSQSGWTTTVQSGCPDAHIHIARRSDSGGIKDAVKFKITANQVSQDQTFYFNEIPNLPPNATNFISPVIGNGYSGIFDISWDPASDANGDQLSYRIILQNTATGSTEVLQTGTTNTSFSFDSTGSYPDGTYTLFGQVCDGVNPCVDFNLGDTFSLNNTIPHYSLQQIAIYSNNVDTSLAQTGNQVNLNFVASGTGLSGPQVSFYSNGDSVNNPVTIEGIGTSSFVAHFFVDENDSQGIVTFTIDDLNLDQRYFDTTNSSVVTINNPIPTATPTPTPTPTSTSSPPAPASSDGPFASVPSAPFCHNLPPPMAPNLFQIDISQNRARLFFTPISNITKYYVSFSEKPNAQEHGEEVVLSPQGVQSHTVYWLKANTTYYFKVRGQNGCMPGDWSNILAATTRSNNFFYYHSVYKNQTSKSPTLRSTSNFKITTNTSPSPSVTTTNNLPTYRPLDIQSSPTPTPTASKDNLWLKIIRFFKQR